MANHDADPLAFDDVVIDFGGRRLLRGGVEQPLEPKAFAVLALLAAAPGRVFARDEILDAVWGHRHVTPGVLNRIMTLLRQALGENAQHPHRLHTLHGIGYRFDLQAPAGTGAPGTTQAPGPWTAPATAGADAAAEHAHDVPVRGARARRWPWLLAASSAAVVLLLAGIHAPRPPPASAPAAMPAAAAAPPTLVVMPLKPIGDGGSVRSLAEGLSEELICSLARIDGLRVIARDSTRLLAGESDPAAQAKQLGITHALEGNLQQSGQQLRVRLRMVDTGSGDLLWTRDFDRDATEALSLQRDIAEAVAGSLSLRLGLSMPTAQGGDAEFLERYLQARMLALRQDLPPADSVEAAERQLRALLLERPDDARVHAWLAVALRARVHRLPTPDPALAQEMVREAQRALQLDPTRYEPFLVLAADECAHRRWEPCMAHLARARALAPGAMYVHLDSAWAFMQVGQFERAEAHARTAVGLDPINPKARLLLAGILDARGNHDEAARLYAQSPPNTGPGHWFNAVWRRDADEALRLATGFDPADAALAALRPSAIAVSRALADAASWAPAAAATRQADARAGRPDLARLLAPDASAQADALAAQLVDARMAGRSGLDLLLWAKPLAWLRATPAFQGYLRDTGILAYWRTHGFPAQCRPEGGGAACD